MTPRGSSSRDGKELHHSTILYPIHQSTKEMEVAAVKNKAVARSLTPPGSISQWGTADPCSRRQTSRSNNSSPQASWNRASPAYAGAKFSDAPPPSILPKPPKHWLCNERRLPPTTVANFVTASCAAHLVNEMSDNLKLLLNVQA